MDEYGLDTVQSDVKMSVYAIRFWQRLRPRGEARKFVRETLLASEAAERGESEPPDVVESRLYGRVQAPLQDHRFVLSRDPEVWRDTEFQRECELVVTWHAPEAVIERFDDAEPYFEWLGAHDVRARAVLAAEHGAGESFAGTSIGGPQVAVELRLRPETWRKLRDLPENQRNGQITGWVVGCLDEFGEQ